MVSKRGAWWRKVAGALSLVGFFSLTRIYHLTFLPIFTDEAIYIRWSQIGSRDAAWRFISLVDGKQPLYTWIAMVLMRFIEDPVLAGRFVSVIAGFGSMVAMFLLGREFFRSARIGFIASALYVLSPFALVYDRMALYDSLTAMLALWSLYLAVLLVRHVRLDIALLLGMTLGLAVLNKSSGFLSLYMIPATLLLFDIQKSNRLRRFGMWFACVFVVVLVSQSMYSILRLSPLFHMVAQKDTVFIYPFREWLQHPLEFFMGNIRGMFDWLIHYLTWPIWIAVLLPAVSFWKYGREKMLLYVWCFTPFIALALFGRVLYPRFILFMTLPLLMLAAITIETVLVRWKKTLMAVAIMAILLWSSIFTDYLLLTNPTHAPIPQADRGQYINDWPAGWGVRETRDFLLQESKKGSIAVYTEGTFGLLPYGLEIWLVDNPRIKIQGIWPLTQTPPPDVFASVKAGPTYLVANQPEDVPDGWPLTLIAFYSKGLRSDRTLRLYKVEEPAATKSSTLQRSIKS
ncbi:glycosyltransferase family 39 protein [Candidatus Gottesmanbacteria bacterium]|nr:glycosyltransferase family 39 protein [Candidatus Gottesmanbacteria bacterium]